ncbi:MAG TPA: hypothetical protein VGX23_17765 [Actinocrinis sp.]|nr:hypothetical protein [Actinocrinis sp.]
MTIEQVGSAMFGFLAYSRFGEQGKVPSTARGALSLLTGLDEYHAPGGLLLRDCLSGTRAAPGCCCDLFEWRGRLGALDKLPVDLGHDPAPRVEYNGDVVRVWSGEAGPDERTGTHTDIDRTALPAMLQAVRRDLFGFLEALHDWAAQIDPGQADDLVAAFDAGLAISEPLTMSRSPGLPLLWSRRRRRAEPADRELHQTFGLGGGGVQCFAEAVFDAHVAGQGGEPAAQRVQRGLGREGFGHGAGEPVDAVLVDLEEQGFAGGEVPVERSRADARTFGDRVERGVGGPGEHVVRDLEDHLPVLERVGALLGGFGHRSS